MKSPKKKKRGLFGLGKLTKSFDSDDESDRQLGPGAQYTSGIGHQGEIDLNDGEFYTSDADTSGHSRGRGRGRGERGERDRSRSLSVTRALKKLVSMKSVGEKKIKKKKGEDENEYQPPVMDNIESTFDESIKFGDSANDGLVADNEEGLSESRLERKIKKNKLTKKKSDDASAQIFETPTPGGSKKKKIKLGTKADQSDGALHISPISLDNDSVSSSIMASPKGTGMLSPKKKKKKLGSGNRPSSIRFDEEEATQELSPGMLSPTTKMKSRRGEINRAESSDGSISSLGTTLSAKMKKKKKKLKILADEVQEEVVTQGGKSVKVKRFKADVQDEMRRVVQRWDSRAEMIGNSRMSQGIVLHTADPMPSESENEKEDVLGDWLEPVNSKSKKPGKYTTLIVSDEDTTRSMTPDSLQSGKQSKEVIENEDDLWGKTSPTQVQAENSEFNVKTNTTQGRRASPTDFKVTKKRLDDFDTFASSWNGDLAKAGKIEDDEETVKSMAETVSSLSHQIDRYREESRGVQKQLAESMKRIARLTEDHRHEESRADKASNELIEIQIELSRFSDEKKDMAESLMKAKENVLLKDHRIESLEAAVESQLDTVEVLEEKLGQTEDELFEMEGEIKYLEEISHAEARIPSDQRTSRMESIRVERMERTSATSARLLGFTHSAKVGSHHKQNSLGASLKKSRRSVQFESIGDFEKRVEELEIWEDELDAREKQMNVDKEYDELREKRLDEWEHDLIEKELVEGGMLTDELAEKREELEEFEKILEEERDTLEFEKNELAQAREESAAMSDRNGDELQELVARLEEDIGTLKKQNKQLKAAIESNKDSTDILKMQAEHNENVLVLQAEIAKQLAKMDEENHKFTGRIKNEKAQFDQKLKIRDETITDLSETMARMKKKLDATDNGAYVIALLDDMNELRKQGRENLALKDGLEESNIRLRGKEDIINILQKDLMQMNKVNAGGAQAGDKARSKELEAELERVKLELLTGSNMDEGQLNIEIQSLKESVKDYKKKLKQEQKDTENKMERKDEAIVFMQQEMVRMKKELDKELKKAKKDKRKAGKESDVEVDIKQQIEQLEDEIEHWKSVNYELEDEVSHLKTEANVWKRKAGYKQGDSTDDDDVSEGSLHSVSSVRSATNDPLNSSMHSISSINQSDMFYVSDKTSAGNIVAASDEPTTPSQRLARSLASLWNKPANSGPSKPAGLYGALDDK